MPALTSTDLKTRFTEKIQKLPEVARVEAYDSKTGKYTIIFPYSATEKLYSKDGLDFVNLLSKMKKTGLKIINHQSETIESPDLSDKDFEDFTIIDSEKNFVITFTDDSGILSPKLKPRKEKKEPNRTLSNVNLSNLTHQVTTLGTSNEISDIKELVGILSDSHKKADKESREAIGFELKFYSGKLNHLMARKESIQYVKKYRSIRKELEKFQKQKNFDYIREIDTKLQDLKKIKENLIPELRQIDEKNTEILVEIQSFIDSFEKHLEGKDNNFIFFHASVSNDSKKIKAAINQYKVILGNTKEPLRKVEIDNYISMLTELLGKLESSVKEIL
ncbi:MAG: hypothetical protein K940chlam5_01068 [Candidatus Anoxychlamydiales bacterium]|nr:hypothetical protein [Candidatus Anoxychlamydiales bacterium]